MKKEVRKKVYVIVGKEFGSIKDYSMDKVKEDIKLEGYKFDFHFNREFKCLIEADEVWVFGDCKDYGDYNEAIRKGFDIWRMG